MALMKRNETETETEVKTEAETPKVSQEAAPDTNKKEVAVKPKAGAVAQTQGIWFTNEKMQEVVATAQYGDFESVVASNGQFATAGQNGKSLGKVIEFKPIQAKVKLICSPNSNDDESKEYFAAAYEGETTLDGRSIEECVEDAKAAGYEKADIKEYVDLFAYVVNSEEGDFAGEVVVLQLSPMSKVEWRRFSKKLETKAAYGNLDIAGEIVFRAIAVVDKNKGGKSYTKFTFDLV